MGNVQMDAEQIRYKGSDYKNLQTAMDAALGGGGGGGLDERVTALETTVGDEESGLVKDVDDLETTVGDAEGGLVKDVNDLETAVSGLLPLIFSTTATKIGKWGTDDLYMQLVDGGTMTGANLDIDYTLPSGATMRGLFGSGTTAGAFIPLTFTNVVQVANSIAIHYDSSNSKIKITSGASEAGTSITAVVLYSVAASNNR